MEENESVKQTIQNKLKQIEAILEECTDIAEKNEVWFSWNGPAYGMGGSYRPKMEYLKDEWDYNENEKLQEAREANPNLTFEEWAKSRLAEMPDESDNWPPRYGWVSSSSGC